MHEKLPNGYDRKIHLFRLYRLDFGLPAHCYQLMISVNEMFRPVGVHGRFMM